MSRRTYHSPARDEAKLETRRRILDALVEVIREDGIHGFSMENVAAKAGVTHRTVYRHFASREELLEGLSGSIDEIAGPGVAFEMPTTMEGLADVIEPAYRVFGKHRDRLEAAVITSIAMRFVSSSRRQRMALLRDYVEKAYPHLDAKELEEAIAMTNVVASSMTWFYLTTEQRLANDRAARAVAWTLRLISTDLARRDRERARK